MATTMTMSLFASLLSSRIGQQYAKKKLGENMDILLSFRDILAAEGREGESKALVKSTLALCAKLAASKAPARDGRGHGGSGAARDAVWVFLEDLHTLCWATLRGSGGSGGAPAAGNEALDELRTVWAATRAAVCQTLSARLGQRDMLLFEDLAAQLEDVVVLILTQPRHAESLARVKGSLNTLLSSRL
jgi:hypothetical protein